MRRVTIIGLAMVTISLLASCSGRDQDGAGGPAKSTAKVWQGEPPIAAGWLRDRLPQNALAYQRLPNPFGFFAAPKGNALDDALASDANVRNLISIRESLVKNILEEFDELDNAHMRLLVQQLRSPVETAALGPDEHSVAFSILAAATLDLSTSQEFEKLIADFLADIPGVALSGGLDDDGFGQLDGLPFPIVMRFDAANGQTLLLAGPSVSLDLLRTRIATLAPGGEHPMHALEKDIDESGHGYFFWADPKNAMKLGQMFMPADAWQQMHDSGLDQVDSLAFGWGVANGKGRLRVAAALPDVAARKFVPNISNSFTVQSVGTPDMVVLLSVPTEEYLARIETLIEAEMGAEEWQEWLETKDAVKDGLGLTIEEIMGALGPEFMYIADDVGDYLAVRVRDEALWTKVVGAVNAKTGGSLETHEHRGKTLHHWVLPSLLGLGNALDSQQAQTVVSLVTRMKEHFYWTREGDFMLVSQVPQPLMDRIERGADTDVDKWLRDSQRHDLSEALFAVSARTKKLPRRLYYVYLEILQAFADLANADYDPWSPPTAAQLDLREGGAIGYSLNMGDPVLSMEIMFENSPLEGILGGSASTVAVVGILAAIAIPAYQDYTMRAHVGGAFVATGRHKTLIAEHYQQFGRYPNAEELARDLAPTLDSEHFVIEVEPDTGVIVVSFSNAVLGEDPRVHFKPDFGGAGKPFQCSTNMPFKYVPTTCQNAD